MPVIPNGQRTAWWVAAASIFACGCAGSINASGSAGGGAGKSSIDELQQLADGIDADVREVLSPVDQADALLADLKAMKLELGGSFDAAFAASTQDDSNALASISEASRDKLRALSDRAALIAQKLQSVPEACTTLVSNLAERATQIPQLAASATAEAQLALNNPFASDDEKAKAQAATATLSTLPTDLVAKVNAAKNQIATLPARAASTLQDIAVLTGISATALAAAAPTGSNAAADAPVAGTSRPTEEISPLQALERAGPWVAKSVDRGRKRIERASAALDSLRDALSVAPGPRATSTEVQTHAERVARYAAEAQSATSALAQLADQTTQLNGAVEDLEHQLPEIAASADLWADHALADFGADDAYKVRALEQKRSVLRIEVEALVMIQLARHEMADWPTRTVELQTESRTLLAQVPGLPAPSSQNAEALFEPFPAVSGPPAVDDDYEAAPAAVSIAETPSEAKDDDGSSTPLIASAVLTTAALVAAIYTVDRAAAFNDCVGKAEGYGCLNTDAISDQASAGRVVTVVLSAGALVSFIWALVD